MGNQVFISYSKKDSHFLDELRVHLSYLEREYKFEIWEDSKIRAGDDWRNEIYEAIEKTSIAVLLVSANFIASDFINSEELPALLEIAENKGAKIFSVILSHCMFSDIDAIAKLQSLNPPNQPVIEMDTAARDAFYMKVTQEIKKGLITQISPSQLKKKPKKLITNLELAFFKVRVVKLLYKNPQKMTISNMQKELAIEKRKILVQIIQELITEEMLLKEKEISGVCYFLSAKGIKVCSSYITNN
ncbi:toll/interleukin-1 receptor domain-containing protein [Aquimarina agarilytica]|uniref:toll/interleukin-1 receptor domain-containing protein n=1 Tax=Aquimarina agarilytica TaxID=1087449 RepID=UPI0002891947|nr:toll/interleukin-1 receptor domain-containing protein [Aquimarina agarilytica]